MFYLPKQKAQLTHEVAVAPGAIFTSEGQAAVRTSGDTAAGVRPSTGNNTDVFAGFVIAGTAGAAFNEEYYSKVETLTVPSSGSIQLQFEPVANQVGVYDVTDSAAVPISGGVSISGKVISGLTAAHEVTVTYKYPLTVVQARTLQGDATPGGYAGNHLGQIGLVTHGTIYTNNFDNSNNWGAATAVKLSANGQLTDQSGGGVAINATVIELPSVEVPFLGLEVYL